MARAWIGAIGGWFVLFILPNHGMMRFTTSMKAPIARFRIIFINPLGARLQLEEYPNQPVQEITIDRMIGRGGVIFGTPDDGIARIRQLQDATGGFGGMLMLAHEWATREKTLHSYELWARYVAP